MSGPHHTLLMLAHRGALPFEALHGAPLYLHALHALVEAFPAGTVVIVDPVDEGRVRREVDAARLGARVLTLEAWWRELAALPRAPLLVHDALCPLTSAEFLREVRALSARDTGASLMAFRPVTDTVKTVDGDRIGGTIDRSELAALTSPVVVAAASVERAVARDEALPLADFAELAAWLRACGPVELVKAPSMARRVEDPSAVNLLECLDEVGRRVRVGPGAEPRPPRGRRGRLSGG